MNEGRRRKMLRWISLCRVQPRAAEAFRLRNWRKHGLADIYLCGGDYEGSSLIQVGSSRATCQFRPTAHRIRRRTGRRGVRPPDSSRHHQVPHCQARTREPIMRHTSSARGHAKNRDSSREENAPCTKPGQRKRHFVVRSKMQSLLLPWAYRTRD